jgi:hypothetical protein
MKGALANCLAASQISTTTMSHLCSSLRNATASSSRGKCTNLSPTQAGEPCKKVSKKAYLPSKAQEQARTCVAKAKSTKITALDDPNFRIIMLCCSSAKSVPPPRPPRVILQHKRTIEVWGSRAKLLNRPDVSL